MNNPTLTIIAGVNGSGKTTFALDYFKDNLTVYNQSIMDEILRVKNVK